MPVSHLLLLLYVQADAGPQPRLLHCVVRELEDPRKMLDQAVADMQADLIKMRQAAAQARSQSPVLLLGLPDLLLSLVTGRPCSTRHSCTCMRDGEQQHGVPPDVYRSLRPAFARLCRAGLDACMGPGGQIVATQQLMENRQRGAANAADEWQRRAELALRAGDEDLARAALTRRKSYQVLLGPGCSLFL
jgi:hypothetical protein